MAFHKNLVEKDLHAPSRYKANNIASSLTPGADVAAYRAVVIHGHELGLINVLPITSSSHIGLYGISESAFGPGEEAYITTFGVLRDVPIPLGIGRADHIAIDITSATGELLLEDTNNTNHRRVAISLSDRSPAGTTTILVIGGVPSVGTSTGGGTAPSTIEEFKGFFDPNTSTYPTDNVSSNDEVREGDYFIVSADVAGPRPVTTLLTPDTIDDDIFGDVIVGDIVYSMINDFNGSFNFDNFYINRTVTPEEREILQDLKPADDGLMGDVLVVRSSDPTAPDQTIIEKDYELRRLNATEVDIDSSLHFSGDANVLESTDDLAVRIRSIMPSVLQGPWDPDVPASGFPLVTVGTDYILGNFWRVTISSATPTTSITIDGNPVNIADGDLIFYNNPVDPQVSVVSTFDDFFIIESGDIPADLVNNINFYSATPGTQTQVGVSFDSVRGVSTLVPLIQEDNRGTISIAVPSGGSDVVEISTSAAQALVGRNSNENVESSGVQIIASTQTILQGLDVLNTKIDDLVADDIEPFPDVSNNRASGNILIDDGGAELAFRHPTTEDIEIGGFTTGDLDALEDPIPTEANGLINSILQGRIEFRGTFDPATLNFPTEIADVEASYLIRGWFWIVTNDGSLGVSPTLDLATDQLLFADPSTMGARKTGSTSDPITATDFFRAGGSGTGGGGGTGDSPFEGVFMLQDGPPDFDAADVGDYWIVTANTAGENFDAIPEDLSIGDLVVKVIDRATPIAGDFAVFYAATNSTFLKLDDLDDPNALVPGDGYASYPDSFTPNTTNIVTTDDLMAPVINGVDESLAFASIYTFNQGGNDLSNGTYNRSLTLDHTDTDTDTTFSTVLPWDSTVYKLRNTGSSTSFLVEVTDVVGITHINGYPLSSQIDLSPVSGGGSTTRDAVLATVTSFTLEVQGNAVIVELENATPGDPGNTSKDYTDSDFEGTDTTPSLGMFNIVTTTGSNDSKSFQIILNEPVTRTDITSGTSVRLTNLTLSITRESGSTTNVPTEAAYDTSALTWRQPDITFGSAALERASGTNRVSQSGATLYSFLSQFDNIDVTINYNTPIDFTSFTVTNSTIPSTTLPSFVDAPTPVMVTTASVQSVDVSLDSADIITEATTTLPIFRVDAEFTYTDGELNNPQSPSITDNRSIITTGVNYGYDVWYGTVAEFDSNGNPTDFSAITINDLTAPSQPANFSFTPLTVLPDNTVTGLNALRNFSVTYTVINESVYRILIIRRDLVDGRTLVWQSDNGPFIISNNRLDSIFITDTLGNPIEFGIYQVALTGAVTTTGNFEVDGI